MRLPTASGAYGQGYCTLRRMLLIAFVLFSGLVLSSPAQAQTGSIRGFVVDTLGNPISGARIAATSGPSAPLQTTSAADGSYALSRLNPGIYAFTVSRTGYTNASRSFTVNSGINARLDFTLRAEVTQGGELGGHVFVRGTSTPVAGALVTLTGGAGTVGQSAITDANGLYQFSNLTSGRVRLSVSRAGFVTESRQINVVQGRTIVADFNLRLRTSDLASLSGVITDSVTGLPVRGAVIALSGGTSTGLSDMTDSRGRYSITRVIPDTYSVAVSANGYVASTGSSVTLGQDAAVVLNLSLTPLGNATGGVAGLVVNSTGQVIAGARVTILAGPVTGRSDTTDATGFYELLALPAGNYTLRASATGFVPRTLTVSIATDETESLDFSLTPQSNQLLGSILGQVTQADGTGVAGVTVRITAGPSVGQTTQSDSEGDYSIPDLPIGVYALTFTRSGFAPRTVTDIEVNSGLSTTVDVVLGVSNASGTLTGTVTNSAGAALSTVLVTVLQNGSTVTTATTSSQGVYQISDLPAGTYVVQFSKSGYTTAQLSGVQIVAGSSTTANAQLSTNNGGTGTFSGLVVDPLGRPVQGATLVLEGPSGTLNTTTDAEGEFEFTNLAPGTTYVLTITASGYLTETRRNLTVTSGSDTNLRIQLRQDTSSGGSLSGFVRNTSGLPVVGAVVTVVAGPAVGQVRTTSGTGQFSFAGLPGGAYTIEVRAPNYRSVRQTLTVRPGAGAFAVITLRR